MIGIIGNTQGVASEINPQATAANSSPLMPPPTAIGVTSIAAATAAICAWYAAVSTASFARVASSAGLAVGGVGFTAGLGGFGFPWAAGSPGSTSKSSSGNLLTGRQDVLHTWTFDPTNVSFARPTGASALTATGMSHVTETEY